MDIKDYKIPRLTAQEIQELQFEQALRIIEKKIQKAKATYKIYCDLGTLQKTRDATGLAIRTIRRYIALTEELNHKSKLSSKDRYYNTEDDIYNIYNNNIYNK